MTVQNVDLFHCQKCGRIAYEPHGSAAPSCCEQPMVRAVADMVKDVSPRDMEGEPVQADLAEHALLSELVEIANWCRRVADADVARYTSLSQKLGDLYRALADRFQHLEHEARTRSGLYEEASPKSDYLSEERFRILSHLDLLLRDLQVGESNLAWDTVCDRVDALSTEFVRCEQREIEFQRASERGRID